MKSRRGRKPLRDWPAIVWLLGVVIISGVHRWVPEATWLMIHLVLLGALSHAVMIWSRHFSHALLKVPTSPAAERRHDVRLGLLTAGSLVVFITVPLAQWWAVVVGALLVSVAVVWHGAELLSDLRRALPGRFRITIVAYIAAAACLPFGAAFGVALARGQGTAWQARLLVAHSVTNLLGWLGLTVVGTLITFWPTVLRTRMDERAERLAKQSLPVLIGGLVVLVGGSLAGLRPAQVAGLAIYLGGLLWWARALARPLRTKPPKQFAGASIGAAVVWFILCSVWLGVLLLTRDDQQLAAAYPLLGGIFAVGFGAQILTGALSYLIPSVFGGGPSVVRAGNAWFDKGAAFRLVVINLGLVLFLTPVPGWVKVGVSSAVLLALAWFLGLFAGAMKSLIAARRVIARGETPAPFAEAQSIWTSNQLIAAVVALTVVVAAGIGVDPGAVGLGDQGKGQAAVQATGKTVRVAVTAKDMAFTPAQITVNRGDRVIIELTNVDSTQIHDLRIAGVSSPRLARGEKAELDLGVVGESSQGWCTVVGHRQMGMTFDLVVTGSQSSSGPDASSRVDARQKVKANPETPLATTVDPALAALGPEKVHRLTLTVTEVALEVAPGVWQKRWTFNGASVGPTLHGRVGDVFEITLVNDGTMGHSIDFHAGALAPDRPMRTIAPGESLTYRFTATRAGIWMYHCSTMPMSSHIAAGMHGAVVIEPEGLPAVDQSYLLVQSEVFLQGPAASAEEATEVNATAIEAQDPDFVVFNGIANQYDQRRLTATVGQRVRIWVLSAGPNRPSSFHIVGGQFDTVYFEGGYLLKQGKDAFGSTDGGSQALGLQPAQGGFVELTFPEAGNYPVVSHVMSDAERGAHGYVQVSPA